METESTREAFGPIGTIVNLSKFFAHLLLRYILSIFLVFLQNLIFDFFQPLFEDVIENQLLEQVR
jgi:hypothetical protein